MNTDQLIRLLVALWYVLISRDHHKDRDCHFHIAQHWKYDGEMEWELQHYGYILHDREEIETFPTQEAAKEALLKLLINGITNELHPTFGLTATYRKQPIDNLGKLHRELGGMTMNLKDGLGITTLLTRLALTLKGLNAPAFTGSTAPAGERSEPRVA